MRARWNTLIIIYIVRCHLIVGCHSFEIDQKLIRDIMTLRLKNIGAVYHTTAKSTSVYSTAVVVTTSGPVIGGASIDGHHAFYEIPYAEPPVGNLRWKDPVPIQNPYAAINGTVNSYVRCYQEPNNWNIVESEDCLTLNIFVPSTVLLAATSQNLLPVMFYIHGGSFKIGSGTEAALDGKELSRVTNTVVVTINYRLGALGFLTLDEDGQDYIEGNQGLKDQRLALQWVQDNIANFGGSKNQVTIFGNSAGAQSVMLHVVSEKSKDLFRNAIQQSNPSIYSFYYPTPKTALAISRRLIEELGCNGTSVAERQCLLNTPPEKIVEKGQSVEVTTVMEEENVLYDEETFLPIVDGKDITDLPMNLFKTGQWNKDKNLIIGVNTEESLNFQFYFPEGAVVDKDFLLELNELVFGVEYGKTITERYSEDFPPEEGQDYKVTFGHEVSHYTFDCPSRLMARYASDTGDGDVYFYTNSHRVLFDYCVYLQGGNTTGCKLAFHASEIRYVFRTLLESQEINDDDRVIENEFSTYWGSFARTDSPSQSLENPVGDFPPWPTYEATNDGNSWRHMEITTPISKVQYAYKEDICDFWDSINYARSTGRLDLPLKWMYLTIGVMQLILVH